MISKEESVFFQLDDFSSNWKKYFWIKQFNQPNLFNAYGYCDTFWGFRGFCFRKKKIVSTQLLGFIKFRDGDLKHWGSPNRRQIPHRNISINFVVIAPLLVNGTRCTQIPVNDEKFDH